MSHRGGNPTLVEQLKQQLAAIPRPPLADGAVHLSEGIENRGFRDNENDIYPPSHASSFTSNVNNQQDDDHDMTFSASMSNAANRALPNYPRMRQQQYMSFPWDSMTGETNASFSSNFDAANPSAAAALQRFLGDTMGGSAGVISGV